MSENVDKIYVLGPDGKQMFRVEDMNLSTTFAFQLLRNVRETLHWGRGDSSLAFAFNSLSPQQDAKLAEFIGSYGSAAIPENTLQRQAKRRAPSGLPTSLHNDLVAERAAGKVVRAFAFSQRNIPPLDLMSKRTIIALAESAPTAIYAHMKIESL